MIQVLPLLLIGRVVSIRPWCRWWKTCKKREPGPRWAVAGAS